MLPAENGTTRRTICSGYLAASPDGACAHAPEHAAASAPKAIHKLLQRAHGDPPGSSQGVVSRATL